MNIAKPDPHSRENRHRCKWCGNLTWPAENVPNGGVVQVKGVWQCKSDGQCKRRYKARTKYNPVEWAKVGIKWNPEWGK